ncbi:hypothetical protein ACFX1X_022233 [Malus domestica]
MYRVVIASWLEINPYALAEVPQHEFFNRSLDVWSCRCSIVSGLVKYDTNNTPPSSQVRKTSQLGTCKTQVTE